MALAIGITVAIILVSIFIIVNKNSWGDEGGCRKND
jgi:hypothetical protein